MYCLAPKVTSSQEKKKKKKNKSKLIHTYAFTVISIPVEEINHLF